MENEYPMTAVLIPDDDDETVYLQFGIDEPTDGELMKRSQLPTDAYPSAGSITAEPAGGEPGVFYPLWIVER